jgi:hypothetical protein
MLDSPMSAPHRDTDERPPLIHAAGPEACAAWDEFVAGEGLKPSTQKLYRKQAVHFLRWLEAQSLGLAEVTPAHVASYLDSQGICYQSWKIYRSRVRRLFALLVARRVLPSNPAKGKGIGRSTSVPVAAPSPELSAAMPAASETGERPPTLADLKTVLWELDHIREDSKYFRPGLVALYPLVVGGMDLQQIAAFTGIPLAEVELYAGRLRENGIWTPDDKIAVEFDDPASDEAIVELALIIGCAAGIFVRTDASSSTEDSGAEAKWDIGCPES